MKFRFRDYQEATKRRGEAGGGMNGMKDRHVESRLSRLVSDYKATSPYMTRDPCTAYVQHRGQLFTEQTLRQTENDSEIACQRGFPAAIQSCFNPPHDTKCHYGNLEAISHTPLYYRKAGEKAQQEWRKRKRSNQSHSTHQELLSNHRDSWVEREPERKRKPILLFYIYTPIPIVAVLQCCSLPASAKAQQSSSIRSLFVWLYSSQQGFSRCCITQGVQNTGAHRYVTGRRLTVETWQEVFTPFVPLSLHPLLGKADQTRLNSHVYECADALCEWVCRVFIPSGMQGRDDYAEHYSNKKEEDEEAEARLALLIDGSVRCGKSFHPHLVVFSRFKNDSNFMH
ncbi:hypothetical protein INR49_024793 [Caranx melampygus]|nr:hypothetical protein INR49_024793 [Caranx melampygus]